MKTRYLLPVLCILIILLSACDDFLREDPKTILSPEAAYNTEEGLDNGANGLYDRLAIPFFRNSNFASMMGYWNGSTDCCESRSDEGGYGFRAINDLDFSSETSYLNTFWEYYYKIMTNAQLVITYSEKLNWKDKDLEKRVKGEAYFFRAFGHFYLTQFFGDIPIVDKIYNTVKLDWERNSKTQVMSFVIDDLKKAEAYLPTTPWKGQGGRITRGTAQHLLSYAYLCNKDWPNAELYSRKLITDGYHKLTKARFGKKVSDANGNVFWDMFQNGNLNYQSGNTEGLLVIQNEPNELYPEVVDGDDKNLYALFARFFLPIYTTNATGISNTNDADMLKYGGRGRGYILPASYWVDLYTPDPQDLRGKWPCIQKRFENKKTGAVVADWDLGILKGSPSYRPYPTKWNWDGESRAGSFGTDAMTRDFYFYRVAETYLILAEALHQQGKNSITDGAAFYINEVRTRSGAKPIAAADVTIDYILDERARELFGEIPRRIDLLRTNKFIERANLYNPGVKGKATNKHLLLPIPQSIIDLNTGRKMEQNPEW